MSAAWDIYAQQLMHLRHGHALWIPEPSPKYGEVNLGDVGILHEGRFHVLFNAMRDANSQVDMERGVPHDFEPLVPPSPAIVDVANYIEPGQLHSKSLQDVAVSATATASESCASATLGLRYQCSQEAGALLMLKQPAHKKLLICKELIRQYIRTHIARWCEFANSRLYLGIQEKDIIFVSGTTKTSIWAEAAFRHSGASGELVITGGCFVPSASGEFRVSMSRCTDASVFSRVGPYDRASAWKGDGGPPREENDQCIFLNYYKIKRRRFLGLLPSVIQAAAGPHQLPDSGCDDDSDGTRLSQSTNSDSYSDEDACEKDSYDPVDCLLDYMLENSDAEFACASDSDLSVLLDNGGKYSDIKDLLRLAAPKIECDEIGSFIIVPRVASPTDPANPQLDCSYKVESEDDMDSYDHITPAPQPFPGSAKYIAHTDGAATTKLSDRVRRKCYNCRTTDTSTWRRSSLNLGKVLCNKCGLYERTHSRPRPAQFPQKRGTVVAASHSKQDWDMSPAAPPRSPTSSTQSLPHQFSHLSLSPLVDARSSADIQQQQQYRDGEICGLPNGAEEAQGEASASTSGWPQPDGQQYEQPPTHGVKRPGSPLEPPPRESTGCPPSSLLLGRSDVDPTTAGFDYKLNAV